MKSAIYYRQSLMEEEELQIAKQYFSCSSLIGYLPLDCLIVIPRYSLLPFAKDLEEEIVFLGCSLINTYQEHQYVTDISNWYQDLKDFTPQTWFNLAEIPEEGPFVLKGRTNSRKNNWNTMMYASNKQEAIRIGISLLNDPLICDQNIVIRKYIPLVNYGTAINGCPIAKEFRFFCYKGKILTGGFYWSNYSEELIEKGIYPTSKELNSAASFTQLILERIQNKIPFVVIDVAMTKLGEWILIELNDGQMSGLADVNPEELYRNLRFELDKEVE